jgi:hypothetical protein
MDCRSIADFVAAGSTLVIAGTGVWALIYAHRQLTESRETEKVRHLVDFNKEFDSEPMATYRKAVAEGRLKGDAFPPQAIKLLDFFETIGLLVSRGYLDGYDVWSTFSYWMFNIYSDFRDEIDQIRRDDENYYGDFCDLIEVLRKIEKENGGSDDRPSRDEIKDFWEDEAATIAGSPIKRRKTPKAKIS